MSADRDPFDDYEDHPPRPRRRAYDDGFDDPRWSDQRDDYDDGSSPRVRPEDRVRGPGTALAAVGWACLAATILALGVILLIGLNDPPPDDELIVDVIIGGVLGAVGIAYFLVIALGGHRMRQCRGYGLAMTSAVLATASIALLGLFSVVILPFGIWAIVVLSQADVRRAFDRARHPYD